MAAVQIAIRGTGPIAEAVWRLARETDFETHVWSGEPGDLDHPGTKGPLLVLIATRDADSDLEALRPLAGLSLSWIGVVGSSGKWAHMRRQLEADGADPAWLDQISSPAGLDIGSVTPAEIAVAIVAEIVEVRARLRREGLAG